MPLLNYQTTVTASKTIGEMQAMLAKAGASHMGTSYDNGEPSGLSFTIPTAHGTRSFLLPCDPAAVGRVMDKQKVAPRANRTVADVVWRILKDWLEAQLALIETQMATLDQVMLPYMTDASGRTVYDLYASQQLALGSGE